MESATDDGRLAGRGTPLDGGRLRRLFEAARELAGSERTDFVARHTDGEDELRSELEALLRHAEVVGDFLAEPVRPGTRRVAAAGRHAPQALVPGDRLGDHEVESFLASGGGGQVYRARQLSLGRRVALKVVATAGLSDADRERFLRGARLAAEIHHPHMVEVYDSGEDEARGLVHYSMRLVEGCSLEESLAARAGSAPVTGEERRGLVERFREVAGALAALHERGVIHRDVKPANILVEGAAHGGEGARGFAGRAVLVDYGLVTHLDTATRSTAIGTLPYAPPELFLEGKTDARADVYGLGLCLYDLLTCPAARRAGPARELPSLREVAPEIDLDLEAVVQRCIEPVVVDRYANGGELEQDLAAWLAGRPVRARRLTCMERGRRFVRRHPERVLRWGVMGTVLAIALALVIAVPLVSLRLREHAARAKAAWVAGDLLESRRAAAELPASLREFFLEGSGSVRAADPAARALEEVLREGEQRSEADALLLAARYLERDGLAAHTDLARFLVHGLRAPATEAAALRLTTRLFFDRPIELSSELPVAAPFRAYLAERLRDARTSDAEFLYCLSALGGCGDADSCAAIASALEERSHDENAQGREELRVGLRALEFIARRAYATGEGAALAGQAWDSRFRSLERTLERSRSWPGPDYGVSEAFDGLLLAVALRRNESQVEPLAYEVGGDWPLRQLFRAVNRDPRLMELRHRPCDLFGALLPRSATCDQVRVAGAALVALGEPFTPEQRRAALQPFTSEELSLDGALKYLDEGLQGAREEQHGFPDDWRPDRDTQLGEWFSEQHAPWIHERRHADVEPPSRVLARWEFHGVAADLTLAVTGLDRLCSPIIPDAGCGFVRLGIAGHSEARFRFRTEPDERRKMLVLRLRYQKGRRAFLPYSGEASILVSFEDQVQRVPAGDEATYDVDLQLFPRRVGADGEHVVSVRLEDSSTTTFRIYRAEVLDLHPAPDLPRLSARDAPDEDGDE